jgi:hypothetical protein
MATTTNFGWTTPDNTGYVKDGALAIRTLGSAIDSTLYDLDRVGQVVQTVTSTSTGSTSSTYADATNMSATITPTKSTSKVLITMNFNCSIDGRIDDGVAWAKFRINNGATQLYQLSNFGHYATFSTGAFSSYIANGNNTLIFLDSPATTSAVTYKLQFGRSGSLGTISINGTNQEGTVTLQEVIV